MKLPKMLFVIFASLVLFSTGCDGKVKMSGKVTYSDDGSPVPTGTVGFETNTFLARGAIKPDGVFQVSSTGNNDGLPPGKYRVYLSGVERQIGIDDNNHPIMEPLIDKKYFDASTSGLTIEVTPETKNYDIKVDRYVTAARKR